MSRALAFWLGIAVLIAVWATPLPAQMAGPFSRHMAVHMAVVALAAPLIALGVAAGRFDPVRAFPRLFPPVPISAVELFVVWAWHAPALHHFARHTGAGLALEQGTFLASALLVWLSALGGVRAARPDRRAAGVVALLLTSMHMTLLGALLALPPRPLYLHPGGNAGDALDDQHLGGAIMLLGGGVAYLLGGLWLTASLLRRRALEASSAAASREPRRALARP